MLMIIVVILMIITASGNYIENDFESKNVDNKNDQYDFCNTLHSFDLYF